MQATLIDRSGGGKETARITLEVQDRITVRDLIRLRVRDEVARHNSAPAIVFRGLVQPNDAEADLNGYRLRTPRQLDWERQANAAINAFGRNGFVVLVGGRQVEDLDEAVDLTAAAEVTFIKLVPLVGG